MFLRDFLPSPVSIKREYLPKSTKPHQILHAMSGAQKIPVGVQPQRGFMLKIKN